MGGGEACPMAQDKPQNQTALALRVITHNIRYATTNLLKHERPWSERLPGTMSQLHHYTVLPFNPESTIICLQEVLREQLDDIKKSFEDENYSTNSAWECVGVGRDDGKSAGEFNPIFYRSACWKKLHFETIWLSSTPNQVSRGWHGGCNRICTCLVLQRLVGDEKVMILNTHLDNASFTARQKGAKLILEYAKRWKDQFDPAHLFLTGDLNSTQDEKEGAWQVLNSKGSGFVDCQRLLKTGEHESRRFGGSITFTGFDGKGDEDGIGTLDFIHYGLREGETLSKVRSNLRGYTVVPNIFDQGTRCSDHCAVVADFLL